MAVSEDLTFLDWLLLVGAAGGGVYLVAAALAVRRFALRPRPRPGATPPVTVLKPLCGEDPELYENLLSFCRQDYPTWQIVFGVQNPSDPAVAIVNRLIAEFPEADLALVVKGGRNLGNLKVANLQNMLPKARHDLLVIADSDIRVGPDYLIAVTSSLMERDVGLVTCLYRGRPARGLWSSLGALHINHGFLPQALVGAGLGAAWGCFGATVALRRSMLDAIGGFAALADRLADDYALGEAVRRRGQRVQITPYLVDNIISEPSLGALFRHELRWARTIRTVAPAGFLGSLVTHPLVLAVFANLMGGGALVPAAILILVMACRGAMARVVDRSLGLPPSPLALLPVRDILSFAVFVTSFFARTVAWRDQRFRIGAGGHLLPSRR
jgi:ceramide glucosyltransferase